MIVPYALDTSSIRACWPSCVPPRVRTVAYTLNRPDRVTRGRDEHGDAAAGRDHVLLAGRGQARLAGQVDPDRDVHRQPVAHRHRQPAGAGAQQDRQVRLDHADRAGQRPRTGRPRRPASLRAPAVPPPRHALDTARSSAWRSGVISWLGSTGVGVVRVAAHRALHVPLLRVGSRRPCAATWCATSATALVRRVVQADRRPAGAGAGVAAASDVGLRVVPGQHGRGRGQELLGLLLGRRPAARRRDQHRIARRPRRTRSGRSSRPARPAPRARSRPRSAGRCAAPSPARPPGRSAPPSAPRRR